MWEKNGNVLELESSNSDYLAIDKQVADDLLSTISFDIDFEGASDIVLCYGSLYSDSTNCFFVKEQNVGLTFVVGISPVTDQSFVFSGYTGQRLRVRLDNLELYVDEVLVHTFTEVTIPNLSTYTSGIKLGRLGLTTEYGSFTTYSTIVQGEKFLLIHKPRPISIQRRARGNDNK